MMPAKRNDADALLTVAEAQAALKCSRSKILSLARDGQLEMLTLGRRSLRITDRSVQRLIEDAIRNRRAAAPARA